MAATEVLFILSDNLVQVTNVKSKATGAWINDATVTLLRLVVDLDGEDGDEVAGSTDIDCPKVADVDGAYYGVLPSTAVASLTQSGEYAAYVEIDGGAGRLKTFRRKLRAVWANA
jgi:hypothetical protein